MDVAGSLFRNLFVLTDARQLELQSLALVLGLGALCLLGNPDLAAASDLGGPQHHATEIFQLAENEDFWSNVGRYGSYFFSVLLGTAYVAVKPLIALFKKPVTAAFAVALLIGLYIFVSFTVKSMLGIEDPLGMQPL